MGAVFANAPIQPTVVAVQVMPIYFDAPCKILPRWQTRDYEYPAGRLYQGSDGRSESVHEVCVFNPTQGEEGQELKS